MQVAITSSWLLRTGFLFLSGAMSSLAGETAAVIYSKSFPGSTPPFVSIEITSSGNAVYKDAPDDEAPVSFKIAPEDAESIFGLVEKLEHFRNPLESNLNVARMGEKTFRFEKGEEKHEVKFNYSLDENARLLLDWFERISETQQLHLEFERTARFDRLGVNKTLLQIEMAWNRNRLIPADRFLPLLDRVAKNDAYLHMARERAASLAEAFRRPRVKAGE